MRVSRAFRHRHLHCASDVFLSPVSAMAIAAIVKNSEIAHTPLTAAADVW